MSSLGIFDKETKTYKKVADLSKTAVIDSAMSDTSTNAVQNKTIKEYVDAKKVPTFERNGSIFIGGDSAYVTWANGRISSSYADDENGRHMTYKFPKTGAWTVCNFYITIPAHTVVLCQFYSNRGVVSINESLFLYNQGDTPMNNKNVSCTITEANEGNEIIVTCNLIAIKNV